MLKASNLLATFAANGSTAESTVALNCNTLTGAPPSATIVVKANPTLTLTNQLIVSATLTGANLSSFVITAPVIQTLALSGANTATSLTYTVTLAATPLVGCQGLTSTTVATVNFFHIAGTAAVPNASATPAADVTVGVTTTVNGGSAVASALTTSVSTISLTCQKSGATYYPGPAQTVTVGSGATGGTPFALDGSAPALSFVSYPTPIPGSSVATAGSQVTFTVQPSSTCGGNPVSSTPVTTTISLASTLLGSGVVVADKTITVSMVVSGPGASPLVVIPSPITVTCSKVPIPGFPGTYTYVPTYPQTVSVTSPATGGTAFTIGTTAPTWLSIGTPSGGTASASAVTFTLQAQGTAQSTNCNGGVATSIAIHLTNAPNNDAVFSVALQIVTPTVLTAAPTSATFTYVKGSGTAGFADVAITSSVLNAYFAVTDASLPSWLRSSPSSGAAPQSIRFSSTNVADTLAPGTYTASVVVSVSGYGDLTIPVSMLLTNKAAQMTIQGPTTVNLIWTEGSAYPTPTITVLSTDTPIAYVATTGGSLGPVVTAGQQSGLAYSFGTPIGVSFTPQAFATASPGNVLTGTVTLTWGNPASTIVVTFDVTVQAPGATITSLSPSTEAYGQSSFTVALTGTGFVQGVATTQATRVGIVTTPGAAMTFDTAINPTIINGSNMSIQFIYPGAGYSGHIPFISSLGGSVVIGVCNPLAGVACQIATASQTLYFGSSPIVQAVVSSSSLLQTGTVPTVAPYDMVSIFGSNFCPFCATSGSNSVLTGSPDRLTLTYPTSIVFTPTTAQTLLTPPVVAGTLSVAFQAHTGGTAFTTTNAPLLFATNGQINLMVPSVVPIASPVDIVVSYTPAGGSAQSSTIYTVNIVATDPGIFTIGADGQGGGAILDLTNNLISSTNPAGLRSTTVTGNSDIVSVYMTGLGLPDSTASNASAGASAWSADCVSASTYLTSFNAQNTGTAISSLDGTLIVTGPLNVGRLVPCLLSGGTDAVSLTIGNQPVTSILYSGWTPDTIAGLYQVTFRLPDNVAAGFTTQSGALLQTISAPIQVPVYITSDGNTTQTGVSIWVAPRLLMTGPISNSVPNTMSVKVGTPLTNTYSTANAVVATGGPGGSTNSSYTYAITSGLLPPGLSMIPTGTYGGQIIGTPSANTGAPGSNAYTVTVTATDSEAIPVTGTVTFVVTVGNGLYMTDTAPTTATFNTADLTVTTVTATGGVAPYFYVLPNGYTTATGIAISQSTGVISTAATTKAGTYSLAVSAFDSGTTPLSTTTFPVTVGLNVAAVTPNSVTASTWSTSVAYNPAIVTTGGGGGGNAYVYSVDPITTAFLAQNSWVTFDSATGIFTIGTLPVATTSFTVTVTVVDSGTLPTDASAFGTGSVTFPFVIH